MDIAQFKKKAEVTKYNTNNGWGFGGSIGTSYKYKGLELRQGKWCYRHAKAESYIQYFNQEGLGVTLSGFEELLFSIE